MSTVSELCREFAHSTTISGLYLIVIFKNYFVKLAWTLVALGLLVANCWQTYVNISTFLDQPTSFQIKLSNNPLAFPTISFCNANPFLSGKINYTTAPGIYNLLNDLETSLYGPPKSQPATDGQLFTTTSQEKTTTKKNTVSSTTQPERSTLLSSLCPNVTSTTDKSTTSQSSSSVSQSTTSSSISSTSTTSSSTSSSRSSTSSTNTPTTTVLTTETADFGCDDGWDQVGESCYYFTNQTGTWNQTMSYCSINNSLPPIFHHLDDYLLFQDWWNNQTSNSSVWLGLTYNKTSNMWVWLDGCPFLFLHGFWRGRWDQGFMNSLVNNIFTKYSNAPLTPGYSSWVNVTHGTETAAPNDPGIYSVCYKPTSKGKHCFNFPTRKETGYLCSYGEWFCTNDHAEGHNASSSVDADSCFCFSHQKRNFIDAVAYCNSSGGFLADIRSPEEFDLLTFLLQQFAKNENAISNTCPTGFSYFNGTCFVFSGPQNNPFSWANSGQEAHTFCQNHFGNSSSVSLHSVYEHWFVYYLMMSNNSGNNWIFGDNGMYLGTVRNSLSTPWYYLDGSPLDYLATWTIWPWWTQPDGQLNQCIGKDSGLAHDFPVGSLPYVCRQDRQSIYPIFVNFLSNSSTLDCTAECATSTNITSSLFRFIITSNYSLEATDTNSAQSFFCRKDRNIAAETPFCSSNPSCIPNKPTTTTKITTTAITTTIGTKRSSLPSTFSTLCQEPTTTVEKKSTAEESTSTALSSAITTSSINMHSLNNRGLESIAEAQEKLLYEATQMDPEALSKLSYTLDEILQYCDFNGITCNKNLFTKTFYPSVGNCFSFNDNSFNAHIQNEPGRSHGLYIVLKSDPSSYILTSLSPGFLISIHGRNEPVFPDSQAMKVVADFPTDISMILSIVDKISTKNLKCVDTSNQQFQNYSIEGCIRKCQQTRVISDCKCADPVLPTIIGTKFCKWTESNNNNNNNRFIS